MTTYFANGTKFAFSRVASTPAVFTAITNAVEAVVTAAAPPAIGSIVVLNSGWPGATEVPFRVKTSAAGSFTLEGFDTTSLTEFPAGEGIGTFQVFSSFITLSQVLTAPITGGDQNFHDFQFIEDRSSRQRRKPTFKSAMSQALTLAYDPDLPWYPEMVKLDRKNEQVVMRETTPTGALILYYGYPGFNKVPTKDVNVNQQVAVTFSINSDPTRYPAVAA